MNRVQKCFSVLLAVILLLTAAPLSGFVGLEWQDIDFPSFAFPEINLPDFDFNFSADAAEIVKSGSCGTNVNYTLDSDGVLTISGTGEMENYNSWDNYNSPWYSNRSAIKTVIIENGVTSIGYCAFRYCTKLTSVTIPDSVTSIGGAAFYECYSLTSVTIGNSVTSIGDSAFEYCTSLTSVTLPDSVTSIGYRAFYDCTKLTSVTIPDSVTSIGRYAFGDCISLTTITIPDSVTSIGEHAFYYCTALTSVTFSANSRLISIGDYAFFHCTSLTSVTIGDSVTSIGEHAFWCCTSLTSVTIGDSVTSIGDGAFYSTSLTSITIPDSVTSIGDDAFSYCTSLTSVTFSANSRLTSIGDAAFSHCTSLTSVTIGDSVTSIGNWAFYYCTSLTSVIIPDSVTSIEDRAFYECTSLTEITVESGNKYYSNDEYGVLFNKDKTTLIQYPIGNARITYSIPDSVTNIGDWAFSHCISLTSVTFSANSRLTSIGNGAFDNCTSLTSITIPDSVTSIGDKAFCYCTSLTSVTFSANSRLTSIGDWAFSYCTSLTSVIIPDSATSIGNVAFGNCTSLTSVTIPDSVTSIGNGAFSYCDSLTSVTIPDSVTSIGYAAFLSCTSLTSITILNPDCEIYDSEYTIYEGTTIYGYTDSTAQAYAEKYNRKFVALDEPDPHEHSYTSTVTLPATCCTTGVMTYTCECEDSYTEIIPFDFTNHVGGTEVRDAVPATCTDGYTGDTYCLGCNTKIADGEIIPGTGAHTPDSYTEPASCTVNGYTMTFCTECGEELDFEVIPATHKWDDGIITTAATCVEEGVITYTCTVCEDTKTESTPIDPEQHTGETELRNAVPATPEQPGYSGDLYCRSCGNLLEAGVTVNLGDVDFDGKITPEDARLALREATGYKELTYAQIAAADCDRNGAIQAADSRLIMRASVGLELLWSYASIDFELLPLDPDNNSSVSVETDWTPDHSNEIVLHIYLDECVDLTSCHLQLSYDSDSFTHSDSYRYAGMDAEETQKATTNSFTWEIGRGNDGVLLLGGYFKKSLWDAETFLASSKDPNDPCIVNDKKFHAFTIHLDVTDKSYLCNGTTVFVEGNLTFEKEDGTIVAIGVKKSVTHDGLPGQHYGGFGECITGTRTCSICGTKYNLYAEYHEWNEWIVVTEATFEAEGLQERTCSVCSAKETEIIPVLETKEFEDKDSGISVETDKDAYGGKDVEVKVEEVFDGSHYLGQSFGKHETWNIKTYVDGEQVQPETPVYVRIPLPKGFDPNKTFVYHINSQTNEREKMDAEIIDGYICFYTSSFSIYIVVDESSLVEASEVYLIKPYTIAEVTDNGIVVTKADITVADLLASSNATDVLTTTGAKADATAKLSTGMQLVILDGETVVDSMQIAVQGDVDLNCNVDSSDARLALRAAVKLETLTEAQTQAADADKNGEIEAADARLILRAAVGLGTL